MEYLNTLIPYGIGTIAGITLFRHAVKESIIVKTIDNLVENDYCRSYVNENGEVELYKWYELEDVIEEIKKAEADEDV